MRRIGILLGSFNPIHYGHLYMATSAITQGYVDKVLFVPSMQNPWKESYGVSFDFRCAMIHLATFSFAPQIQLCRVDEKSTTPYFTYKTLKLLKNLYPDDKLCLLIGTDVVSTIKDWKNGHEILKEFEIISVGRPWYDQNADIHLNMDVSSTKIRESIKNNESIYDYVPSVVSKFIESNNLYKNEEFSN